MKNFFKAIFERCRIAIVCFIVRHKEGWDPTPAVKVIYLYPNALKKRLIIIRLKSQQEMVDPHGDLVNIDIAMKVVAGAFNKYTKDFHFTTEPTQIWSDAAQGFVPAPTIKIILQDKIELLATPESHPTDYVPLGHAFGDGKVLVQKGLPIATLATVLAHEVGHILGHWGHGGSYLMQTVTEADLGVDFLVKDFCRGWLNPTYEEFLTNMTLVDGTMSKTYEINSPFMTNTTVQEMREEMDGEIRTFPAPSLETPVTLDNNFTIVVPSGNIVSLPLKPREKV